MTQKQVTVQTNPGVFSVHVTAYEDVDYHLMFHVSFSKLIEHQLGWQWDKPKRRWQLVDPLGKLPRLLCDSILAKEPQ